MSNLMRLDKYFVAKHADFSRSKVQEMIEKGLILVNGVKVKANYLVKESDKISFKLRKKPEKSFKKSGLNFPILYQDKACMVINKPAGVSVYPINSDDKSPTVLDFVENIIKYKFNDPRRPGIVHRLDKETSGVLILAKNQSSLENLMAQFKAREVKKVYLALVSGGLQYPEGIINSPIARSHRHRKKMSLVGPGLGREAISAYKVLKVFRIDHKHIFSLLEVQIFTGRTHQIRVHMSSIGHPVVGDVTYGNPALNRFFGKKFGFKRQFLHSYLIGFKSPDTKKEISVKAALPKELKDLKTRLQL
ncbi:RluA family pseudouridine synthase [Candidatus Peregrinibacteria bacterium]|nr:RluA family pseudouridine synthase [Candidatus Peregrinibacteria bacterium]